MIDLDLLEKEARTRSTIYVSPKWVMAVVRELRGNRQRITELEAENSNLREGMATKSTVTDFPHKEMDEAFGLMDEAFGRVFGKRK